MTTVDGAVELVLRKHLPVSIAAETFCLCDVTRTYPGPVGHRLHVAAELRKAGLLAKPTWRARFAATFFWEVRHENDQREEDRDMTSKGERRLTGGRHWWCRHWWWRGTWVATVAKDNLFWRCTRCSAKRHYVRGLLPSGKAAY